MMLPAETFTFLLCTFWFCLVAPAVGAEGLCTCDDVCFCSGTYVLCHTNAGLTSIPQDLPTDITHL